MISHEEDDTARTAAASGATSRAKKAHIRQSRLDSDFGFEVKVLKIFEVAPIWLGSGMADLSLQEKCSHSYLIESAYEIIFKK